MKFEIHQNDPDDPFIFHLVDDTGEVLLTGPESSGRGVAAERLEFHGFGSTRPVAEGDTDDGRQSNRRLEVVVTAP